MRRFRNRPEEKKEEHPKPPAIDSGPGDAQPHEETALTIDIEGIEDRVQAFPVPEGIYQQIDGVTGKALFTSLPVEGSLERSSMPGSEPPAKATLEMFDFETGQAEIVVKDITDFQLSGDRKTLVYRAGNRLRAIKAGEKAAENAAKEAPGRKSGWVDLNRVRLYVEPPNEWKQMYGEAWRMQKEGRGSPHARPTQRRVANPTFETFAQLRKSTTITVKLKANR